MSQIKHYILDKNHNPVDVPLLEWGRWMEEDTRRVNETTIRGYRVSTIFLGLDQNIMNPNHDHPILFETMVFPENKESGEWEYQERYETWTAAMDGHNFVCTHLIRGGDIDTKGVLVCFNEKQKLADIGSILKLIWLSRYLRYSLPGSFMAGVNYIMRKLGLIK